LLVMLLLAPGLLLSAKDPCLLAYQSADDASRAFLKNKKQTRYHSAWEKVITRFERIAKSHPSCEKADDALFRAGKLRLECQRMSGLKDDKENALADFEDLARKYPKSSLADDSLLYAGKIYLDLKDKESAGRAFRQILVLYPQGDCGSQARKYLHDLGPAAQKLDPAEFGDTETPGKIFAAASPEEAANRGQAGAPLRNNDAIALMLSNPGAQILPRARVEELRYWSAPSYTRVVLDLDRRAEFSPPRLLRPDPAIRTPPRIYFDLLNTELSAGFRSRYSYKDNCYELQIADGLLERARAGQFKPEVVRVALDLKSIRDFKAFEFPGGDGAGWRIVIDIYGEQAEVIPGPGPAVKPLPQAPVSPTPGPKPGPAPKPAGKRSLIFIIDPGHGGKDPGAVGKKNTREKDVALAVAENLERELARQFPSAKIMLTRGNDRYVSLVERTAKANALASNHVDSRDAVFISIHCNATPGRSAAGIETYYLDNTTDRAALKLAAQENFVSEELMQDAGADITNKILADLTTNDKVNQSIPLADCIQKALVRELKSKYSGVSNLGVKKAPFWVLTGATMPSVLVELSFLSNLQEERRLSQPSYQKSLSRGIAAGVREYERRMESGLVVLP